MKKRKWCYVLPPHAFEMRCDKCHGSHIDWSEYEHKIWCFDCGIDTDGEQGVFGGPIPLHTVYMLGLNFDRVNLETEQIERLNLDKSKEGDLVWDDPEEVEKVLGTKKERVINTLKDIDVAGDPYGVKLREYGKKHFKLVPTKIDETEDKRQLLKSKLKR